MQSTRHRKIFRLVYFWLIKFGKFRRKISFWLISFRIFLFTFLRTFPNRLSCRLHAAMPPIYNKISIKNITFYWRNLSTSKAVSTLKSINIVRKYIQGLLFLVFSKKFALFLLLRANVLMCVWNFMKMLPQPWHIISIEIQAPNCALVLPLLVI